MIIDPNKTTPIYIQVAQWLELQILAGHFKSEEKMYSQYQLAEMFTINPATAAKSLQLLANEKIVYKKRGLGMFVTKEARAIIFTKRKEQVLKKLVKDLVFEAKRLQVQESKLIEMIQSAYQEGEELNESD